MLTRAAKARTLVNNIPCCQMQSCLVARALKVHISRGFKQFALQCTAPVNRIQPVQPMHTAVERGITTVLVLPFQAANISGDIPAARTGHAFILQREDGHRDLGH